MNCRFLSVTRTRRSPTTARASTTSDCYCRGGRRSHFRQRHRRVRSRGGEERSAAGRSPPPRPRPTSPTASSSSTPHSLRQRLWRTTPSGLGRPWHYDQGKIPSYVLHPQLRSAALHPQVAGWDPRGRGKHQPRCNDLAIPEFSPASDAANGTLLTARWQRRARVSEARVAWADPMSASVAGELHARQTSSAPRSFWNADRRRRSSLAGVPGMHRKERRGIRRSLAMTVPEPAAGDCQSSRSFLLSALSHPLTARRATMHRRRSSRQGALVRAARVLMRPHRRRAARRPLPAAEGFRANALGGARGA